MLATIGNSVGGLTVSEIAAGTLVLDSEGIGSNNNNTTIPTSAAVKALVDSSTANNQPLQANAKTTVTTGDFVGFFRSDSADANTFGVHALASGFTQEVLGMVSNDSDVTSGNPISVFKEGQIVEIANLGLNAEDKGKRLYLNGNTSGNQTLTLAAPSTGSVVQVGILIDQTNVGGMNKMFLKIEHIMDN